MTAGGLRTKSDEPHISEDDDVGLYFPPTDPATGVASGSDGQAPELIPEVMFDAMFDRDAEGVLHQLKTVLTLTFN